MCLPTRKENVFFNSKFKLKSTMKILKMFCLQVVRSKLAARHAEVDENGSRGCLTHTICSPRRCSHASVARMVCSVPISPSLFPLSFHRLVVCCRSPSGKRWGLIPLRGEEPVAGIGRLQWRDFGKWQPISGVAGFLAGTWGCILVRHAMAGPSAANPPPSPPLLPTLPGSCRIISAFSAVWQPYVDSAHYDQVRHACTILFVVAMLSLDQITRFRCGAKHHNAEALFLVDRSSA
jgi:hypothetical protein